MQLKQKGLFFAHKFTLAVIYRNLNYKACILLRTKTNGKPTAGYEPIEISKVVFDFLHPPPAFNCFLSNVVGKQCAASRQTSTALQVCRQLGKPLCLELYSAAAEPSEGRGAVVPSNQCRRWKLPCVTEAPPRTIEDELGKKWELGPDSLAQSLCFAFPAFTQICSRSPAAARRWVGGSSRASVAVATRATVWEL